MLPPSRHIPEWPILVIPKDQRKNRFPREVTLAIVVATEHIDGPIVVQDRGVGPPTTDLYEIFMVCEREIALPKLVVAAQSHMACVYICKGTKTSATSVYKEHARLDLYTEAFLVDGGLFGGG